MKYFLIPLLVIAIIGCKRPTEKTIKAKPVAITKSITVNDSTLYKKLLTCYGDVKVGELHIFSIVALDSIGYLFKGVPIDTALIRLFPRGEKTNNFEWYANYKFDIDSNRVGLITRTPSMYESSSINLFIYYKDQHKIKDFIELAEIWGDAGAFYSKVSWIYRDKTGALKCVIGDEYSYDNSIDSDKDTTITEEHKYILVNLQNSVKDTVSRNAKKLFESFKYKHH